MFARIIAIVATSFLFLAAAAAPTSDGSVNQCNGGSISCCNQVQQVNSLDANTSFMYTLLGIDIKSLTGLIGTNCSPISAIGVGSGSSCSAQQVCCQDNHFNGLVVVGCTPINVAL